MATLLQLQVIIFVLAALFSNADAAKGSKLIVIMVDGWKWNYFEKPGLDLPGFRQIFKNGVRAEYMIPDMPTLSYPNYYSIMTGLHCESHGMVGNYMYDEKHNETFLIYQNKPVSLHSYWWSDGEPVWITAVKQGKRASLFHWAGCEVTIKGHDSTFCKKYTDIPTINDFSADINEAVNQLKSDSADLIGIYVELSDSVGHGYGPNSKKLRDTLIQIDEKIQKLMKLLKERNLEDDVNVMIYSDHGMAELSTSRIINITGVIDQVDVKYVLDIGATVNIWPAEGKLEKVYQALKKINNPHMRVFKKEEIPDRWFLKNHYRVPPIFLVADNGWFILTPEQPNIPENPIKGFHGYDNTAEDMRAIFVGFGPDFKANYTSKPFTNVNIYQMMCHLIGITPAPNNGTWSVVKDMLIEGQTSSSQPIYHGVLLSNLFLFLFSVLFSF